MKTFIIEETVSVTYFHRVEADNAKEARDKFYDGIDTEYNIKDEVAWDDATLEIIEEKS